MHLSLSEGVSLFAVGGDAVGVRLVQHLMGTEADGNVGALSSWDTQLGELRTDWSIFSQCQTVSHEIRNTGTWAVGLRHSLAHSF